MTAKKVRLETTAAQYDELHQGANQKRGALCKVSKAALAALLLDHGRLIKYIGVDHLEGHT